MTGLWQVTARARSTFKETLDLDATYARDWSLGSTSGCCYERRCPCSARGEPRDADRGQPPRRRRRARHWGPNLVRNIADSPAGGARVALDTNPRALAAAARHPAPVHSTTQRHAVGSRTRRRHRRDADLDTPRHRRRCSRRGQACLGREALRLVVRRGADLVERAEGRGWCSYRATPSCTARPWCGSKS